MVIYTGRGLVVKRPGVLSKVQMLNLVLGCCRTNGKCTLHSENILGSVFGRTDFSRIFIFGPPDFFADFLAGFFLLIFVGKSAQKNPPGKSPGKSSKIYTTKILRHTSADWPGQKTLRARKNLLRKHFPRH